MGWSAGRYRSGATSLESSWTWGPVGTTDCRPLPREAEHARENRSLGVPRQPLSYESVSMDVVFTHCAGLDVHKKSVTACRITPDPSGQDPEGCLELRQFGTFTLALLALADWLTEAGITHVAMESTGEYWKPVYNLLEGTCEVLLVNAAHVKYVPGRKTDKADARWLAKLMRFGLLQASFIPPAGQRDLRDLTRYRTKLVQERSREVNRVQGVLERANIKLASVASDIMGVSARAMVEALIAGRADPATIATLAQGRMRTKIPALEQALTGIVRPHHRRLLAIQLTHIDFLDEQIETLGTEITACLTALSLASGPPTPTEGPPEAERTVTEAGATSSVSFTQAITLLDTIPGVNQRGAEMLVAEWGVDMLRFGTAARLAAWRGVAPSNNESAGIQRAGPPRKGNRALRAGLTQLAHAAARTKGTYLSALYHRIAARRGKKRAIGAVAHSIVVSAFHMLVRHQPYRELGADYFETHRRQHVVDRLTRRIERLGYRVSLEPQPVTS
jgi:transposase